MTIDREALIANNLKLVHRMAKMFEPRVQDPAISYDDIYSEGCIGLIKAARAFEPELGYTFSTYACKTIIGYILRAIRRKGFVSVSHTTVDIAIKIRKRNLEDKSVEEIARTIGCTIEAAAKAVFYLEMKVVSIDYKLDSSPESADAFERYVPFQEDYSGAHVQDFISQLTARHKDIVERLLVDQTYREIGEKHGTTHQNIHRHIVQIRKAYVQYEALAVSG